MELLGFLQLSLFYLSLVLRVREGWTRCVFGRLVLEIGILEVCRNLKFLGGLKSRPRLRLVSYS